MSEFKELKLYTPLHVEMAVPGQVGSTVLLEGIEPEKKAAYTDRVLAAIRTVQPMEDARNAFLMHTGGYIVSLLHTTELVEGRLYGVSVCRYSGTLSPKEIEDLKYECRSQFESGAGSGFAYCPPQESYRGIYIRFERNIHDPLLTRAELDEALKAGRIPSAPLFTELNKDTFWKLLQEAKRLGGQDLDGAAQWLESQLLMMGPQQARDFDSLVHGYLSLSHKYGLWTAATVILDGCSDDGFMDFCSWLIFQGKETYLAALKDPDSLADVPLYEDGSFGSLPFIGDSAYEKMTGKHTYDNWDHAAHEQLKQELAQDIEYGQGIGYPYKWKDAAAYLPRLCAKYFTPEGLAELVRQDRDTWNANSPDIRNARKTEAKSDRIVRQPPRRTGRKKEDTAR